MTDLDKLRAFQGEIAKVFMDQVLGAVPETGSIQNVSDEEIAQIWEDMGANADITRRVLKQNSDIVDTAMAQAKQVLRLIN